MSCVNGSRCADWPFRYVGRETTSVDGRLEAHPPTISKLNAAVMITSPAGRTERMVMNPLSRNCVRIVVLLMFATAWSGCTGSRPILTRYEYSEIIMGVEGRIVLYAPDEPQARAAARAAFDRMAQLDARLSDYQADSEAMRLSAASGGPPVHVSDDLFRIVFRAKEISHASDAAFDITVGPLAQMWRRARQTGTRPTQEEIDTAKMAVGAHRIGLNEENQTIQLRQPKMQLDFGGIGKGFAADEALVTLAHTGITRCLIDLGGDIRVGDPPWGKSAWSIALPPRLLEAPPTIDLVQAAVVTSSDTEQYVLIDGRRYSHIIDPRTGIALTNGVIATVVARDATTADALASAASVLGPNCALRLAIRFPGSRIWIGR